MPTQEALLTLASSIGFTPSNEQLVAALKAVILLHAVPDAVGRCFGLMSFGDAASRIRTSFVCFTQAKKK